MSMLSFFIAMLCVKYRFISVLDVLDLPDVPQHQPGEISVASSMPKSRRQLPDVDFD